MKNENEDLKEKNRLYLRAYKLMETRLDGIEELNARLLKISDKLNIFLMIYPEFQAIFGEKKKNRKETKKVKAKQIQIRKWKRRREQ